METSSSSSSPPQQQQQQQQAIALGAGTGSKCLREANESVLQPCRYPTLATESIDDFVLFNKQKHLLQQQQQKVVNSNKNATKRAPIVNLKAEYEACGRSYQHAREIIRDITERQRQANVQRQEVEEHQFQAAKYTANYVETRLATEGVPTVNTVQQIMSRKREIATAEAFRLQSSRDLESRCSTSSSHGSETANKDASLSLIKRMEQARQAKQKREIRMALHSAFATGSLDLKALELPVFPMDQVFNTLTLQLAHFITQLNLNHNEIRDFPLQICDVFLGLQEIYAKDNSLSELPDRQLVKLRCLHTLVVETNRLQRTPTKLPGGSLRLISFARNRLQQFHFLDQCTYLVDLDLSHNDFRFVPANFFSLHRLKRLHFQHNQLVSLAIVSQTTQDIEALFGRIARQEEKMQQLDQDQDQEHVDAEELQRLQEQERRKWRVETDPLTNQPVYFHTSTKEVTRVPPKCFQTPIQEDQQQSIVPKLNLEPLTSMSTSTLEQKKKLVVPVNPDDEMVSSDGWKIQAAPLPVHYANEKTMETTQRMPAALDRLGEVEQLEILVLSGNQLEELPHSIGHLVHLKRLEVDNNRLFELPDSFELLKRLECLKVSMNSLSSLPPSIVQLEKLAELDCKLNRLVTLPTDIGQLFRLHTVDLSSNALISIPSSVLQLKRLTVFKLQNNPKLKCPRPESVNADLKAVLWDIHHQMLCDERGGGPPVAKCVAVGIAQECWSTNLHVHREALELIEKAKTTQVLDLHWKNLTVTTLPQQMFSLAQLKELRLSGHQFKELPRQFGTFPKLRILHLRQNLIERFEDDCFQPSDQLVELDLEHNRIRELPASLGKLTKLRILRCANNRLTNLPESMASMRALKELQLAHNHFTSLPVVLVKLSKLRLLDLSFNQMDHLDALNFSLLKKLRVLRVNANRLTDLPSSIGDTPLEELSLAGNRIVHFCKSIVSLSGTLRVLKMQMNQMFQLPYEFRQLTKLQVLECDGNPFRSPPPEIVNSQMLQWIPKYLQKRHERVDEIRSLLTTCGLAFDDQQFAVARIENLLVDKLVYLSKQEMQFFNQRLDAYVNGHFYLPRNGLAGHIAPYLRGVDLVNDLLQLHFVRGQERRLQILQDFVKLCELIKRKKWLDKIDFCYDMTRPWGRNGEEVGVFIVDPNAIFVDLFSREEAAALAAGTITATGPGARGRETKKRQRTGEGDKLVPTEKGNNAKLKGRSANDDDDEEQDDEDVYLPSVMSVLKKRVAHGFKDEQFMHSREQVEDALNHYVGVFGPVGIAHDRVPFLCGCEELLRFGKMHELCFRPGWVVQRMIYTQEEAQRRIDEEQMIQKALQELEPQVRKFLGTKEGHQRFRTEVQAIKTNLRVDKKQLQKKIQKAKLKLKVLKRNHAQFLTKVHRKKSSKNHPPPTADQTEADEAVASEQNVEISMLQGRILTWENRIKAIDTRIGQKYLHFSNEVITKLTENVGKEIKKQIIERQRILAIENGWRRPWDGLNGCEFRKFHKHLQRRRYVAMGLAKAIKKEKFVVSVDQQQEQEEEQQQQQQQQQAKEEEAKAKAKTKSKTKGNQELGDGEANEEVENEEDEVLDDSEDSSADNSIISDVQFDEYDALAANAKDNDDGDEGEVEDDAGKNIVVSDVSDVSSDSDTGAGGGAKGPNKHQDSEDSDL